MSDISINANITPINVTENTAPSHPTTAPQNKDTDTKAASEDVVSEEYGPVVSVSDDGDTVRVKNEKNQEGVHDILQDELNNLKEQESFEMPDFNLHTATTADSQAVASEADVYEAADSYEYEEAEEQTASTDITSYIGYTDQELKQMYLEGDISQIDYNLEMEAREARREAEATDANKFNKSVADSISKISDIDRTANTVNVLENGETSSTIPDELRIQALQNFDTV